MSKLDKDILKVFEKLEKLNPEAKFLSESALSNVTDYVDTGCMVLNAIISGSLHGGVPMGRISGFSGPSAAGKTYIINKILANAQKKGMIPVIFDTEAAVDASSTTGVGLNNDQVKYVPVQTVEDCRNQISAFLDSVIESKMRDKFIISIDSLGNLASQKEVDDAEKGKSATDMGTRAKGLKSMMRLLTFKAAQAGVTILFSNHTYDDPSAMFPTLVKAQSGGKGPVYLASVLVQLAKRDEKHDATRGEASDELLPEANKVSGTTLRALTVKNRFVPPFLECEVYLNFKKGLDKYSGLREMAVNHGVIEQTGATFNLPSEKDGVPGKKLGYYKNWKSDTDLWDTHILPKLEIQLQKQYSYSVDDSVDSKTVVSKEDTKVKTKSA
jgi:RecA/RadA recombinase